MNCFIFWELLNFLFYKISKRDRFYVVKMVFHKFQRRCSGYLGLEMVFRKSPSHFLGWRILELMNSESNFRATIS